MVISKSWRKTWKQNSKPTVALMYEVDPDNGPEKKLVAILKNTLKLKVH